MARIRGTITDPNGAPVPGVQVTVTPAGAGAAIPLVTDAQGIYETAANLPPGAYAVAVAAPQGFQNPAAAQVQAPAGVQPVLQDFQLVAAAAANGGINGQVTDANNAPVPNAQVTATNAAGVAGPAVATDAQGNYAIPALPVGNYNVAVQAPQGFQNPPAAQVAVAAGQPTVQNFQLQAVPAQPPVGSIAGQVTGPNNAAVPGAQVTAAPVGGGAGPAAVQSDNAGNYNIPNVPAGQYNVAVVAPQGFQNPAPAQVAVAAGQQAVQNFQLQPAVAQPQVGSIAGQVVGPNNAAIPGAQVTAAPVGGGAGPAAVQSNNAGNYNIPNVPAGQYNVTAVAPQGFQNPAAVQIAVVAGQQAAQNFQLQAVAAAPVAAGSIGGQVAIVAAAPAGAAAAGGVAAGAVVVTPLANVPVTATLVGGVSLPTVMTDALGQYNIPNVPAGNYVVVAQIPGAVKDAEAAVVVAAIPVVQNLQVQGDAVVDFINKLIGPAFDIESPVSMLEASYAVAFFGVANMVLAGLTESNGTAQDVFGSQRVAGLATELGISEKLPDWQRALREAEALKNDVRDLVGAQSLQRLKTEAKRQFNLGFENTVAANVRFPVLFRRYVDIANDPVLAMDIADQDANNPQADKTVIGKADALLRELKDIIVQIVKSLSKEGQAQTRVDTERWIPVTERALNIAGILGPARNTGDADDQNPWAVVSAMTNKNRATEVTPYVVLGRHGGRLLQLAINIYEDLRRTGALTSFDSESLRPVFQSPRMKGPAGTPRMFYTDQLRVQATYVKNYPVPNWG